MVPAGYGLLRPGNAGSLTNLIVEPRYVAQIPSVAQCQSDEPERIDGNACHGIDPRTNQAGVVRAARFYAGSGMLFVRAAAAFVVS